MFPLSLDFQCIVKSKMSYPARKILPILPIGREILVASLTAMQHGKEKCGNGVYVYSNIYFNVLKI